MFENIPPNFIENYFTPILKGVLKQLENDFQENFEKYKQNFILSFKDICKNINKEHNNLKIGYIS